MFVAYITRYAHPFKPGFVDQNPNRARDLTKMKLGQRSTVRASQYERIVRELKLMFDDLQPAHGESDIEREFMFARFVGKKEGFRYRENEEPFFIWATIDIVKVS